MQACPLHAAVSIVETQRQYLKSTHGTGRACIPRSMSFCQFAFLPRLPVVLVVEDTLEDERYFLNAPYSASCIATSKAPGMPSAQLNSCSAASKEGVIQTEGGPKITCNASTSL